MLVPGLNNFETIQRYCFQHAFIGGYIHLEKNSSSLKIWKKIKHCKRRYLMIPRHERNMWFTVFLVTWVVSWSSFNKPLSATNVQRSLLPSSATSIPLHVSLFESHIFMQVSSSSNKYLGSTDLASNDDLPMYLKYFCAFVDSSFPIYV